MELNRNLCAFSAGSKALRAGRYNGDAKAIVLCVAYNFHERSEFTSFFYFLFYFRNLYYIYIIRAGSRPKSDSVLASRPRCLQVESIEFTSPELSLSCRLPSG